MGVKYFSRVNLRSYLCDFENFFVRLPLPMDPILVDLCNIKAFFRLSRNGSKGALTISCIKKPTKC